MQLNLVDALFFRSPAERDQEYNARASVQDFDKYVKEYADRADAAREQCVGIFDLQYGEGTDERLDLFPVLSGDQPAPLFVFVHGGYWHSQDKKDACVMAKNFTDAGIAVCTVEYTLLPESTLGEIVREVRSAIGWLYRNAGQYGVDPNRIHVSGSSAGGHLCGMLAAQDWPSRYRLPDDVVKSVLALSGLYDVRPLCDTHINQWMQLHIDQAANFSPMFHLPRAGLPVLLATGELETDAFKYQMEAYAAACHDRGVSVQSLIVPKRNHFDVVCELCSPSSEMSRWAFQIILGGRP